MAQNDEWFNDDDFGDSGGWGDMGAPVQQQPPPQQPAQAPVYRQQPPPPVQTKRRAKPAHRRGPQRPRPAPRPPPQPQTDASGFMAFDAPAPPPQNQYGGGGGHQQNPQQAAPNVQPAPNAYPNQQQPHRGAPNPYQQQQPGANPGAGNPFQFGGMDQQAFAQMGMNAATQFMTGNLNADDIASQLQAKLKSQSWFSFEYYKRWFKVDTAYVLRKLFLVCFPIRHDYWARRWDPKAGTYMSPDQDINSPDAYLPLMGYLTYVLAIGWVVGHSDSEQFSPEVMLSSATAALALLLLETTIVLKFGFHMTGVVSQPPPPHFLDLLSYSGYKFVMVDISLMVFLLSESTLVYCVVAGISAICVGIFMFRSFIPYYGDPMDPSRMSVSARGGMFSVMNIFLLIVCVLQVPQVMYLSWAGAAPVVIPDEPVDSAADVVPPER